jgi:integrase
MVVGTPLHFLFIVFYRGDFVMPIVTFTPAFIATGLVVPEGKPKIEYSVQDEPGLFVEVRAGATSIPTWYLRLKNARGTNIYKKLGTVKDVSLTQAKKISRQMKVAHAEELKRAQLQKPVSSEMTLDTFMTEHYFPHAKLHKRSWIRDEQLYRLRIKPVFSESRLCDLTRYQVIQFQNHLSTTGLSPASQDHHIKLLRHALAVAVEHELLERNVLRGIKLLNVENRLHDVASPDELKALVRILRTDSNRPVCHIVMFLLSTGARLSEVLTATRGQLDLDKGLWTIPATTAKSKRSRTVPLNGSAMWVLEEAAKLHHFDTIFANPATGKPFTTITRVWYRLRKAAGIQKMRLHGLRHQVAENMLSQGKNLHDVMVLFGHSSPVVTQRYAGLTMSALREAVDAASLFEQAPSPETSPQLGVVLPFPKAA